LAFACIVLIPYSLFLAFCLWLFVEMSTLSVASSTPTARVIGRLVGELRVTLHGGKNLAQKELLGTMSPYIQVKVGSDELKTEPAHHGGNTPNWKDHIIIFSINYEPNELVHFEVKDHRSLVSDETIGIASLELKDIVAFHSVRRWYQLVHKHDFNHIAGDFEATVEFKGDGVEFFAGGAAVVAINTDTPPVSVQPVQYTGGFAAAPAPVAYAPPAAAAVSYVAPVDAGFVQAEIRQEEREIRREEGREERREEREIRREERDEHHHHHHH
jgi:hypothetical protein